MSKRLWTPSEQRIQASNLNQFIAFARQQSGFEGTSYSELHQWSIADIEGFWQTIWQFYELVGEPGETVLCNAGQMPGAQWFPQAKLNFAENLLRHSGPQTAIIERGEDGRRSEISYDELREQVAVFAQYLRKLDIKKGDCVAGFLPNSRYAIIAMLATASLGAIWSSCSPDFGFSGVLDRFSQIQPKILFATDGYYYGGKTIQSLPQVQQIRDALSSLKQVVIVPYLNTKDRVTPGQQVNTGFEHWQEIIDTTPPDPLHFEAMAFNDPLYVLYSSGTTGKPKCIVHSIGGTLLQHLKELGLHTDVRKGTSLFYYTTCGWMMWNWLVSGLALGAALVIYDGSPFYPEQSVLFDMADQEGIEIFGASAKYYSACEKFGLKPRESHQLVSLKSILSTGSPLTHESFDYLYRDVKQDVCVSSISGGTDIISCFALGCPTLPVYQGELQCLGLGMDVAFYDEDGKALETGKGELVCRQAFPSMPSGFWNDPQGSKYRAAYFERFPGIWAHGDYGELKSHVAPQIAQQGVVIHGRSDAVLNPGGVRIGTAEIYRQVEKIDQVFEAIAIGQNWQDDVRIVLFVRLKEGHTLDQSLADKIKQTIRDNTTPRHVPAKIIQIADIPRTLSGKIVELAVRNVIHGIPVTNTDALANPEALALYENLSELAS